MVPELRKRYNASFSNEKYEAFLAGLASKFNEAPAFRVAESPVFLPDDLKEKLFRACEEITDVIVRPDFKERSKGAILNGQVVPNEDEHTDFLQMDFGICKGENGELTPQLIEVQGFPSLYFFQQMLAEAYKKHFDVSDEYSHLFDLDNEGYVQELRDVIVGDSDPKEVVLLEVEPEKQMTRIDFWACEEMLGIKILCVTDLKVKGKDVFYENEAGELVQIKKIFNRVIFDELIRRDDLEREFYFTKEYNIEWVGHPHWFFRISKFTLPLLDSEFVPKTYFLNELEEYPEDLQNYVLKPLYSFAGSGVLININRYDLEAIEDPENYIIQRKVEYAAVVETMDEPAKCEIRMLMLWKKGEARPKMVNNLARLSKGEMIGVRYNKDKEWVGGSVGYFKK